MTSEHGHGVEEQQKQWSEYMRGKSKEDLEPHLNDKRNPKSPHHTQSFLLWTSRPHLFSHSLSHFHLTIIKRPIPPNLSILCFAKSHTTQTHTHSFPLYNSNHNGLSSSTNHLLLPPFLHKIHRHGGIPIVLHLPSAATVRTGRPATEEAGVRGG